MIGLLQRLWICCKWLLGLAVLAVLFAAYYAHVQVDEAVRAEVEAKLRELLPSTQVQVGSARLVEGEGIEIRNIACSGCLGQAEGQSWLQVEEIFLRCATDWSKLLAGELDLQEVVIRHPRIRIVRRPDGSWNLLDHLPQSKQQSRVPQFRIQGAIVQLVDQTKSPPTTLHLRDCELSLDPTDPSNPETAFHLVGRISGEFTESIEFSGSFDPQTKAIQCRGEIQGLKLRPEFVAALPTQLALPPQIDFRADLAANFQVEFQPNRPQPLRFFVNTALQRGVFRDDRLPLPFRDLEARLSCDSAGFHLHELKGKHGEASFSFSGRTEGLSLPPKVHLEGNTRNLMLHSSWLALMPEDIASVWEEYSPRGLIHADLKLDYDGQELKPDLVVEVVNASFAHEKFPYRLQETTGTIHLQGQRAQISLQAMAGLRPLQIVGTIDEVGPAAAVDVQMVGQDLNYDNALIQALPPQAAEAMRKLNASATFDLQAEITRRAGIEESVQMHVVCQVKNASLMYEHFRYPLNHVQGMIEGYGRSILLPNDEKRQVWTWTFSEFVGRNDTGLVKCHGKLDPPEQGGQLELHFTGSEISLDEELRDALDEKSKRGWQHLNPQGLINLQSSVYYQPGSKPDVYVVLEPLRASFQPNSFPYRLSQVTGTLRFQSGEVRFEDLRGEHDDLTLLASGAWTWQPDGEWQLNVGKLHVDRLRLGPPQENRDLMQALPGNLRQALAALKLEGGGSLSGSLKLQGSGQEDAPVRSEWDLALQCMQVSTLEPVPLKNIYGEIRFQGSHDGKRLGCSGTVDLDTLDYQQFQLTEVQGPLWIDDTQFIIGSLEALNERNSNPPPEASQYLRAKLLGGSVYLTSQVLFDPTPRFHLWAGVYESQLQRYAREMLPGKQKHVSGLVFAEVELRGSHTGTHTLQGNGRAALRQANIYELPAMLSLLSLLSLRQPDTNAFSDGDVSFRIAGPYVYFDEIGFRGDAVSLRGSGNMSLEGDLQMSFYSVVGRDEFRVPLVDQVIGNASQNLLQIRVEGTVQEPKLTRRLVPVVDETLQLFRDLQPNPNRRRQTPFRRAWPGLGSFRLAE